MIRETKIEKVKLSTDQQAAFDAVQQGRNLFITARAGAGKSFLINYIVETLQKPFILCASTGIAATLIGGRTLHSQFLIGMEQNPDESIKSLKSNAKRKKIIRDSKLLIIDEISMVSNKLLDCIDQICREMRHNPRQAFGGLQVIFCGDFLQLPPVFRGANEDGAYCIHSKAWKDARVEPFMLTSNFRQEHDTRFYDILTRVRYNCVNRETVELLKTRELMPNENVIHLYSTNNEVDRHNDRMFAKLDPKTEQRYEMFIDGEPTYVKNFLSNSLFVQDLKIRMNARVMLLVNEDMGGTYLCNGSLGTVVGFDGKYPRVKFDSGTTHTIRMKIITQHEKVLNAEGKLVPGEQLLHVEQVPLKLAYSVSIHKSQGQTFDNAYIDCSRVFTFGQVYVALSRVKTLDGIFINGFEPHKSRCEQTMVDWYIELEKATKQKAVAL